MQVHVIFTDLGEFGWGLSSPQEPSLMAGFATIEDALEGYRDVLAFAGIDVEAADIVTHEQKYHLSPGGHEYYLRFLEPSTSGREELMGRATWSVDHGRMDEDVDRMPTTPSGEHIVITCERDDKISWVLDQLAPGEGATLELYGGNDAVYSVPIFDGDRESIDGEGLKSLGLGRDNTVGELIDAVIGAEMSEMRHVTKRTVAVA